MGATKFWYSELERGQLGRYSDDFLNRVAIALRLSEAERYVLYQYAVGREPAPPGAPTGDVSRSMDRIVQRQTWPAYLSNSAWDVLTWNPAMKVWFPWMPSEPNVMRWVFTYPEARDQLADWKTGWAGPMIAQMRLAHAREPDNHRLTELIREILENNAEARELWDTSPEVKIHPDGDIRGIYLPGRDEPIDIEVVAFTPMRDPTLRLVILMPVMQDSGEVVVSRLPLARTPYDLPSMS